MHKRFLYGFTLVELMVVIVTIVILAGVVVATYSGIQERAHDTAVQTDMTKIADDINIFYANTGKYPAGPVQLAGANTVKVARNSYESTKDALTYCVSQGATAGSAMVLIGLSKSGARYLVQDDGAVKTNTAADNTCGASLPGSLTVPVHTAGGGWINSF